MKYLHIFIAQRILQNSNESVSQHSCESAYDFIADTVVAHCSKSNKLLTCF